MIYQLIKLLIFNKSNNSNSKSVLNLKLRLWGKGCLNKSIEVFVITSVINSKLKDPYNLDGLSQVNTNKINDLQNEIDNKLKDIYSNLNPWQTTLVARHEDRPKSKYFIDNLFDEFIALSGDRFYGEDKSVIAGFARFNSKSVLKKSPYSKIH